MQLASITHDITIGTYEISLIVGKGQFDKIKSIVNFIKFAIPASDRSYEPISKVWTIDEKHWDVVKEVLEFEGWILKTKEPEIPKYTAENFFYNNTPAPQKETAASIASKLGEFLGVKITAQDIQELKSLYRKKARALHPDLGGDANKMAELNRLWTLYSAGGLQ